jgi:hypothetical protein
MYLKKPGEAAETPAMSFQFCLTQLFFGKSEKETFFLALKFVNITIYTNCHERRTRNRNPGI